MLTTENLGVSALVTVDVGPLTVRTVVPEYPEPQVGERLRLRPQEQRLLLYRSDDEGRLIEP